MNETSIKKLRQENLRLKGDLRSVARSFRHDLLSPIGSIDIAAEVLRNLGPEDTAEIRNMAEAVKTSGQEIARLVDRVSFILLASAEAVPAIKIDMAAVVTEALQELEENIGRSTARVQLPATWPEVRGVAAWLHVIWVNLLNNAVRHGCSDPKIAVAWSSEPQGFRFSVTDDGPGVAAAKEAALFTPFDRLHTMTGVGLGLSIVERLIALQGGRCGHERPAAGGALFYFTLPADTGGATDSPRSKLFSIPKNPAQKSPLASVRLRRSPLPRPA